MHIKFIDRGQGMAKAAEIYTFQSHDHNGKLRESVELLRGNPSQVTAVADSLSFKHRYRSAVISWHKDDKPTKEQVNEVLNEFERVAFAGLEGNQYCFYAVWHGEENGAGHIHLVTPRVELQSGKSLNIAPPGWEKTYDLIRDKFNAKHNWASPDPNIDPGRRRLINTSSIGHIATSHAKAKKQLHAAVSQRLQSGLLSEASEVEAFLNDIPGVKVLPRRGNKILSVKVEGIKKNIRLEGAAYERGFSLGEIKQSIGAENKEGTRRDPRDRDAEVERLERELARVVGRRVNYHAERYDQSHNEPTEQTLLDQERDPQRREGVSKSTSGEKKEDSEGVRQSVGELDEDKDETVDHTDNSGDVNRHRAGHRISRPWEMDLKPVPGGKRTVPKDRESEKRTSEDRESQREVHQEGMEQRHRGEERTDSLSQHRRESMDRTIREEQRKLNDRIREGITKYSEDAKRTLQRRAIEYNKEVREELRNHESKVRQGDQRSTNHHRESGSNLEVLRGSKQEYNIQVGGSTDTSVTDTSRSLGRAGGKLTESVSSTESVLSGFGRSIHGIAEWFKELGRKALEKPKKIKSVLGEGVRKAVRMMNPGRRR